MPVSYTHLDVYKRQILALIGFPLDMAAMWISVLLTVVSGVDYVLKNKDCIREI